MAIIRYSESIYKQDKVFSTCNGEKEVDEFKIDFPTSGGVRLKKTGTKPLYSIIQANKVNCELSSVLEQCVHQNQLAVCDIDDVNQAIADFSGLSSMAEWYAGMKNLEETWKNTPLEVREQFGSSKANFINSIGSADFNKKLEDGYAAYSKAYAKRIDVPPPMPFTDVPENMSSNVKVPTVEKGSEK